MAAMAALATMSVPRVWLQRFCLALSRWRSSGPVRHVSKLSSCSILEGLWPVLTRHSLVQPFSMVQ